MSARIGLHSELIAVIMKAVTAFQAAINTVLGLVWADNLEPRLCIDWLFFLTHPDHAFMFRLHQTTNHHQTTETRFTGTQFS